MTEADSKTLNFPSMLSLAVPQNTTMRSNVSADFVDDVDLEDTRVTGYDALLPPQILQEEFPLTAKGKRTVYNARRDAARILKGSDDRLLVVVGPCSIHDPAAAMEYGVLLRDIALELNEDLLIVMRAYFEKPRTTVGWKGLINDPNIDGSFKINRGLRIARALLVHLTDSGLPVGAELLDTISPQFLADCVSWGAIGARTTESQLHRELASGCSFPVGFKNGTDGNLGIAFDAIHAASHPHHFLGVNKHGLAAITRTNGNESCHIVLRGSSQGPNYSKEHIQTAKSSLEAAKLPIRIMVDCSHGNSSKNHNNQPIVAESLASQIESGDSSIFAVMIESNLGAGNQKVPSTGPPTLKYGVSITDACIDWQTTLGVLKRLAESVRTRRGLSA